jgi:UDP-glucuronate decarboxylase
MELINNAVIEEDLEAILQGISKEKEFFSGSRILITGCAGFLGYYFMRFFARYRSELGIEEIIGVDNFLLGKPEWVNALNSDSSSSVKTYSLDVSKLSVNSFPEASKADIIIHLASVASPTFYRKYPLETVDANIWGLRNLLDCYKDKPVRGFLFFSSSEIYGDPVPEAIPIDEEYRGNVATMGPRACYDEAKRFGETICHIYAEQFGFPVTIARPFNNYGPGMNLEDKRVPADFARAIFLNQDIEIFSDGSPTRTFCYISDAITGYLKVLAHKEFDYFNIGIDRPETSIKELAQIYIEQGKELFNYSGSVRFNSPPEKDYLTHNPNRRCPLIDKARKILNFNPAIFLEEGVNRFLKFIKLGDGNL